MAYRRTPLMSSLPTAYNRPAAMAGLGADEVVEADAVVLRRVDANVGELVRLQKAEDFRRKLTVGLTIAGAMFAAVKLGIVAWPKFLEWRAR